MDGDDANREPESATLAGLLRALDSADFGTWSFDPERGETWISGATAQLFGVTDPHVDVQTLLDRVHPDDVDALRRGVLSVVEGEPASLEIDHRVVLDDGEIRWLRLTAATHEHRDSRRVVGTSRDITESRAAREALVRSERRYRQLVDEAPEGILVFELGPRRLVDVNPSAERLFGLTRRRLLALDPFGMCPPVQPDGRPSGEAIEHYLRQSIELGGAHFDWIVRDADGRELSCEVHLAPIDLDGAESLRASLVDVTDRRRLQSVLDQRSRLESLGRLAGGIAHDFNNLLTAIRGHATLAARRTPGDPRFAKDLDTVERAAVRAGELTRQLLVFARQHRVRPKPLDLNARVRDALHMMAPLLPPNVRIKTRLEESLWSVSIDPNQFEQVVLNLVLNARDALPHGGKITVRTGNLPLEEEDTGYAPGVPVGDWVVLSVADTGTGMEPDVLDHVFEPFFTTKEQERGTGLGLATCHSIVQHAGGRLLAESEPGMGSIFRAFLPRAVHAVAEARRRAEARPPAGAGTILVVEDESMVREVAVSSLESAGYRVLSAADAEAALELARRHDGPVDLLVTDVIMPGLSGPQLARRFLDDRPDVPVLYVSGYVQDTAGRDGFSPRGAFLPKPYTPDQLGHKVGEMLRGG